MLKDVSSTAVSAAAIVTGTAFRDDGSAELVAISDMDFDRCRISSTASFTVGERLRLHLRGQGWIEAQVRSALDDGAELVFMTVSRC